MKYTPGLLKTRIEVLLDRGVEELLPEDLYAFSASGFWVEEQNEGVLLKCYPDDVEGFLKTLHAAGIGIRKVAIEKEELQDYVELTRKYFKPIRIEDVTIVAPWSKAGAMGNRIVIEPGMAFGTGRHESTATMLKLMRPIDMKGKTVIDLGCGSAILSLYANMLGAKKIVGVDVDLDSVLSARKNLLLNRSKKIQLVCADLRNLRGKFDIILANLDIQIFTRCADKIENMLKKRAILVASGVLYKDMNRIPALFRRLNVIATGRKNSWCGFVLQAKE